MEIKNEFKNLIPPLTMDEFRLLEISIINEGCRDAILTWGGFIIDGHNRFEICDKHGIEFSTKEIAFDSEDAVKVWMIDNQNGRRNLTDGWKYELMQTKKAILLEKGKANIVEAQKERHGVSLSTIDKDRNHNTRNEIATELGWSTGKVAMADKVWKEAEPEVKEKIKQGETTINQAYVELGRQVKKQEQELRFTELKEKELRPTTGKYDVIVIDPPWKMEKIKRDVAPLQVGFDYPTMEIDDIKNFELPAEENCHVFLWITHKHLPFGFDILMEWAAKYVCTFVWHKNGGFQAFGLPQYNCEFVLYGRIGTPEFIDLKKFNVCFNADRTGHSEKPEYFYEMIKRVTAGKRIDIFNRREIDGFDTWGNQTTGA